ILMSTRGWWRRYTLPRSKQSAARPRLSLESLESRDVPAVSLISAQAGTTDTTANGLSQAFPPGSISDDGRYVVFTSTAPNLVTGQVDKLIQISNASSSSSLFGSTITFTTATAHGLSVNDTVTISGANPSGYNGTFTVDSVPTATTF